MKVACGEKVTTDIQRIIVAPKTPPLAPDADPAAPGDPGEDEDLAEDVCSREAKGKEIIKEVEGATKDRETTRVKEAEEISNREEKAVKIPDETKPLIISGVKCKAVVRISVIVDEEATPAKINV